MRRAVKADDGGGRGKGTELFAAVLIEKKSAGFLSVWLVAIHIVATLSAWFGERVQSRGKKSESR